MRSTVLLAGIAGLALFAPAANAQVPAPSHCRARAALEGGARVG